MIRRCPEKLQLQRLLADKPRERSNPGFILLEQIGGDRIFIEVTGFVLLRPDPDPCRVWLGLELLWTEITEPECNRRLL